MIDTHVERMKKSIQALKDEFNTIRTGRASASLFDKIRVDYYGEKSPLSQVATVSIPEARLVVIQPWDKNLIGEIEKAIQKSELSLNPSNDGKVIRIAIPPLTEERRKELAKHAKAVAAMAANAAQAIGANKLLAKVCGLFHDIGKLKEPACFIENIGAGQPNPHDELTPQESAEKIKEHVIYGKQLAKKYGLQRPIMEAIACHHGNDLIAFFYNKALKEAELNNSQPPNIEDFQYKQEQPQRKEVVIVEIADICEAASRAEFINWKSIDLETIKPFVDKLIMAKMQRRQFDHADITLAELSKIADSIANELCIVYHTRAKYSDRKQPDPQTSITTSYIPPQPQQNSNNLRPAP